jgi:hypothetical protein
VEGGAAAWTGVAGVAGDIGVAAVGGEWKHSDYYDCGSSCSATVTVPVTVAVTSAAVTVAVVRGGIATIDTPTRNAGPSCVSVHTTYNIQHTTLVDVLVFPPVYDTVSTKRDVYKELGRLSAACLYCPVLYCVHILYCYYKYYIASLAKAPAEEAASNMHRSLLLSLSTLSTEATGDRGPALGSRYSTCPTCPTPTPPIPPIPCPIPSSSCVASP